MKKRFPTNFISYLLEKLQLEQCTWFRSSKEVTNCVAANQYTKSDLYETIQSINER